MRKDVLYTWVIHRQTVQVRGPDLAHGVYSVLHHTACVVNNLSLPVNLSTAVRIEGLCAGRFHVGELVFPASGLSHAALPWIKLHLPFVYRIQLSPSLGPNYVWAFHRECFSSYGFLGHMDMEIEVHERFRRFVRPGDKYMYVRASYVQ